MKRVNWFSGQQVQKEDLSYLQESLAGEISSRTSSQYSKGIISPVSTYVGVDVDQTLVIHPFRAYTESGEQIVIPEDKRRLALDLTDDSNRQLGTQGFLEDDQFGWRENTPYIIVARYMEEAARPRPHYRTREPYATRIYGGFKFFAMREGLDPLEENGINPYIILAKAIYTEGTLFVTTAGVTEYAGLDATRVSTTVKSNINGTYDLNSPISVETHIRSIGDPNRVSAKNPHGITAEILGLDASAVPSHEKLFHSNGFIGDPTDVTSCFYASIDSRGIGVDYVSIRNLNTGDNLHYNGNTITEFVYNTDKIYIALTDDNIWPDGTYYIYADLETREIGVAASSQSVVDNRTYNIIYNQQVQYTKSPIHINSLNNNTQYKLYTLTFSESKQYTTIDLHGRGLNLSNFTAMTDHRVFGSISASNLQRNHDGDLVLSFPLKTTAVKFSDKTILTSANAYPTNYVDKSLRLYYVDGTTIKVGAGSCKDSTNKNLLTLKGDYTKNFFTDWNVGPSNKGGLAPLVEKRQGTYHIFVIGKENGDTDVAIDTDINASHCVSSNPSISSPIPDYRYYRRIGSVYVFTIVMPDTTTQLQLKPFITLPDSGNGVETIYTQNIGSGYVDDNGDTVFPIPTIYGGVNTIFSYMRVKLNVTDPAGTTFKEYLPISKTEAPKDGDGYYTVIDLPHTLSLGANDISTFNGKAKFSTTSWQGYIISYFDPRII